ncbi:DinB family protein [Sciscionella sediminilitoris]|uniref:DinB family protein n=1 Tax=Sciscionella sediminilitoris TaxID=1445613 RepID=UPI0004DF279E|nr:DinB family protein [Sciscionella sp. SE31]
MNELTGIAADLHRYLQQSREHVLAKLDGLSEYDIRRPLTPSATNLLGLVKHLATVEFGYLGACVGRPGTITLPWVDDESIWDGADMWAQATESSAELRELYRSVWRHSDESIARLGLDAPARVPWWPEERRDTTLGSLLVRMVDETAHHAGHIDIVRELIDGKGGTDAEDLGGAEWWRNYYAKVSEAAEQHRKPLA